MASILNDVEIKKLIDNGIIIGGDHDCVHPNSYILRLGNDGEILNSGTRFEPHQGFKALKVLPGHSVGITSLEKLNFDREVVHNIYPDDDLHAVISPTTDLSREGIIASTTQVDAGFSGYLNWTLNNTSGSLKKFLFGEKLFRLTIFRLSALEISEKPYKGKYNDSLGYVPSKRPQPPNSIKDEEYAQAHRDKGDGSIAVNLMNWGSPWDDIGKELIINEKLKERLNENLIGVKKEVKNLSDKVDDYKVSIGSDLKRESTTLLYAGIIAFITIIIATFGIVMQIFGDPNIIGFLNKHCQKMGFGLLLLGGFGFVLNLIVFLKLSRSK